MAKKRLHWKRPEPQPIRQPRRQEDDRLSLRGHPRWMQVGLIVGVCLGGAVVRGAGASEAVTPAAVMAYLAAAFVVLVLVTR
jgi:predicted MFS family arabinose efflux permease